MDNEVILVKVGCTIGADRGCTIGARPGVVACIDWEDGGDFGLLRDTVHAFILKNALVVTVYTSATVPYAQCEALLRNGALVSDWPSGTKASDNNAKKLAALKTHWEHTTNRILRIGS